MSNKDDGWTTVENKKRPKGKKKSSQTSSNSSNSNVGTNTDYADWTPVVLSGSRNKKKKAQGTGPTTHTIKYNAGTNKQSGSTNIAKIEADIEEGKHLKNKIPFENRLFKFRHKNYFIQRLRVSEVSQKFL